MEETLRRQISLTLQRARLQAGISQHDLAQAAGIDRSFLSAIESGSRNYSIDTLERILAALHLTLDFTLEHRAR